MSGIPQLIFFGVDLVSFAVGFVTFFALYVAISASLNLEFGYAGIPNFGKVLFVAAGAAFTGAFSGRLALWVLGISDHGDFVGTNINTSQLVENRIIAGVSDGQWSVLPFAFAALVAGGFLVVRTRQKRSKVGAMLVFVGAYTLVSLVGGPELGAFAAAAFALVGGYFLLKGGGRGMIVGVILTGAGLIVAGAAALVGIGLSDIGFAGSIAGGVGMFPVLLESFPLQIMVFCLIISAFIGAFLGFIFSYPAIRLREDYLGMLLLASAQFFQVFLRTTPFFGGSQPIILPNVFAPFSLVYTGFSDVVVALVLSVFAVIIFVYVERVARSPLGRTLKSIRDNDSAARALGKNDVALRRNVLMIASAIAAMAGSMYAFQTGGYEYDTWSRFAWTFWPFLIVIIGGAGNNVGMVVGAAIFTLINNGLAQVQPFLQPYVFFKVNWLSDFLFAGLLFAVLMLRPQGLVPEKPTPTLGRSALEAIALAHGAPAPSRGTGKLRKLLSWLKRPPKSDTR